MENMKIYLGLQVIERYLLAVLSRQFRRSNLDVYT